MSHARNENGDVGSAIVTRSAMKGTWISGVVEHHAVVPGEAVGGVEEHRVEVVERVGEAGEAEVERAGADADQVVDGCSSWLIGSLLPGWW